MKVKNRITIPDQLQGGLKISKIQYYKIKAVIEAFRIKNIALIPSK